MLTMMHYVRMGPDREIGLLQIVLTRTSSLSHSAFLQGRNLVIELISDFSIKTAVRSVLRQDALNDSLTDLRVFDELDSQVKSTSRSIIAFVCEGLDGIEAFDIIHQYTLKFGSRLERELLKGGRAQLRRLCL